MGQVQLWPEKPSVLTAWAHRQALGACSPPDSAVASLNTTADWNPNNAVFAPSAEGDQGMGGIHVNPGLPPPLPTPASQSPSPQAAPISSSRRELISCAQAQLCTNMEIINISFTRLVWPQAAGISGGDNSICNYSCNF